MPEIFYDSTITKIKNVNLPGDEEQILKLIGDRLKLGRAILVKVKDRNSKKEVELAEFADFSQQLERNGIGKENLLVEIIIRDPTTFGIKPHLMPKHLDKNDQNTINWSGERGYGSLSDHIMQSSPMFFRANGNPIDLINIHRGRPIFLICNGPSFNKIDHSLLRQPGIVTFGINNGAQVFRPNYWACVDTPYRFCQSIWADPLIMKFVPMAHFWKQVWDVKGKRYGQAVHTFPNVIGYRRNEWFRSRQFLTEDTINWGNHKDRGGGRSVMLAAIRMCHLLGFKKIYLLGCDFNMSEEQRYFFDEQRTNSAINNNNNSYRILMTRFQELQPLFLEEGLHLFNCNPDSALEAFPKVSLKQALEESIVDTSQSTHGMYCKEQDRQAEAAAAGAQPPPLVSSSKQLAVPENAEDNSETEGDDDIVEPEFDEVEAEAAEEATKEATKV